MPVPGVPVVPGVSADRESSLSEELAADDVSRPLTHGQALVQMGDSPREQRDGAYVDMCCIADHSTPPREGCATA